ncbi:MAG: hypothetical protein RIS35_744, partial [Pseudomonadota bacterium]
MLDLARIDPAGLDECPGQERERQQQTLELGREAI